MSGKCCQRPVYVEVILTAEASFCLQPLEHSSFTPSSSSFSKSEFVRVSKCVCICV